jgi:hypothetical protein
MLQRAAKSDIRIYTTNNNQNVYAITFNETEFVKSTFDEIGLSFIYSEQQYVSTDWL